MRLHDGFTPKMKPVSPRRSAIVAVLDIGTSKIACLIARLTPQSPQEVLRRRSHGIEILGLGHTESAGIKGGAVVDLEVAEAAVRRAVDLAEREAAVQLESVVLAVRHEPKRLIKRLERLGRGHLISICDVTSSNDAPSRDAMDTAWRRAAWPSGVSTYATTTRASSWSSALS